MTARMSIRVVVAIVSCAAAVSVYFLLSAGQARSATEPRTVAEDVVISKIAAFQRSAASGDAVPGATALSGMTRRIGDPTATANHPVWASLSASQLCVQADENGPTACIAPEQLSTKPLIVTGAIWGPGEMPSTLPPPTEIAGVTPNGITSVTINFANDTSETAAVVDNGFYLSATGTTAIKNVEWTNASGEVHQGPEQG